MIKVTEYSDITKYLLDSENFLQQEESFYNLKLGICTAVNSGKAETKDPIFLTITNDEGKLLGCALRNNSEFPLPISKMPEEALLTLSDFLINKNILIKGVVGEINTVEQFTKIWCKRKKVKTKLAMHLGLYEAKKVIMPDHRGDLIIAQANHIDTMKDFISGFMQDCFPDRALDHEANEKLGKRLLENQSLYFYRDHGGNIVSMAANSRSSSNGGTISLVYTPPKWRGRGYGSLVTALLTRKILSTKQIANLFTDMTNALLKRYTQSLLSS